MNNLKYLFPKELIRFWVSRDINRKVLAKYLILMLIIIIFQVSNFLNNENSHSKVVLDSVNSIIDNNFSKMRLTFDLIKTIKDKCDSDDCTLTFLKDFLHKSDSFIGEFFFQKKDSNVVFYVNKNERGIYNLNLEKSLDYKSMKNIGTYKVSSSYISDKTNKLSFLVTTEYRDYILFIEVDFENLFKGLDSELQYYVIMDDKIDEYIYHPDKSKIKSKPDILVLAKIGERTELYIYKSALKYSMYSNDNVFGWHVINTKNLSGLIKNVTMVLSIFIMIFIYYTLFIGLNMLDDLSGLRRKDTFKAKKIDSRVTAFCFLDIDNFKKINDSYGHDVGDETIKAFSHCLKENIRDTDVAFRWGGEEFLVILRGHKYERVDIYTTLERLRSAIEAIEVKGIPSFTVSIGYCDYDRAKNVTSLIKQADIAMYESKRTGRNKVTKYNSFMSHEASVEKSDYRF